MTIPPDQVYLDSSESCYLFTPPGGTSSPTRPAKKRKATSSAKRQISQLPCLFNGKEQIEFANRRFEIYEELWSSQAKKLEAVLEETNSATVESVCNFLKHGIGESNGAGQLQTGLITSGIATSSAGSVFPAIKECLKSQARNLIIRISPAQCLNLKAALKSIISSATQQGLEGDDEEGARRMSQDIHLLNYDLQALEDWVRHTSIDKVVIFLQDSEAFDGSVLTELIDVLSSWRDRIPFMLLVEIGTSVGLFQEKLSRQAVNQLHGTLFEAKGASEVLDALFKCATTPYDDQFLWLGASTSKLLLDRQTEHIQSAKDFISALKYMRMTHFFNNPLTLLSAGKGWSSMSKDHISAIRSLASFKRYASQLLKEGKQQEAAKLSRDDTYLTRVLEPVFSETREKLFALSQTLETIRIIYSFMPDASNPTWSTLYIKAMSGDLAESTVIRELSLYLKRLPSNTMAQLFDALLSVPILELSQLRSALDSLLAEQTSTAPLRSEHDQQQSTLRTTVVAQKVSLSKHQATLSALDTKYSKLVNNIEGEIRRFLTVNLVAPKELVLNEIFIFDSKALCRDVLGPSPRKAIERALSTPHDYLDCECCEGEEGLKASHPTTSILYQLYLESGSMINIADMWAAFQAIISSDAPEGDDEAQNEEPLALFYRALAELRYLGMIKGSRKKTDHVAKLKWKGL